MNIIEQLYNDMLSEHNTQQFNIVYPKNINKNEFINDMKYNKSNDYIINNLKNDNKYLTITNDINEIEKNYYKIKESTGHGNICIRSYNGEKTLIIGCGNNPKVKIPTKTEMFWGNFWKSKKNIHNHKDAYTIDPSMIMNPSIIGFVGFQKFPNIPDKCFDLIYLEGIYINTSNKLFFEELKRMASDKCVLIMGNTDTNGINIIIGPIKMNQNIEDIKKQYTKQGNNWYKNKDYSLKYIILFVIVLMILIYYFSL